MQILRCLCFLLNWHFIKAVLKTHLPVVILKKESCSQHLGAAMDRACQFAIKSGLFLACMAAILKALALPTATNPAGVAPELLSQAAAKIIAAEIPREFERKKDWGRTKEVTTGVRSSGNFFKFDIHRQTSEVNHGIWKHYRLTLVDSDKNLDVKIEGLRTLESGRVALTLNVAAKVHGWARAKVYDRGIHIVALEAEGDTNIRLSLDAEIGVESVKSDSFLPGYAIDPVVTAARLKFDDFRLTRISDVRGTLAHELGIVLREAVEDELKGQKLANKINHSINKHRDRLQLTPEMLLGNTAPKEKAAAKRMGGAN